MLVYVGLLAPSQLIDSRVIDGIVLSTSPRLRVFIPQVYMIVYIHTHTYVWYGDIMTWCDIWYGYDVIENKPYGRGLSATKL